MIMILEKSVANLLKTMYGQSTALISTMSTTAYLRDRPRAQLNVGDWSMPEVQDIIQSMFTL
jgi:hypothetical protein